MGVDAIVVRHALGRRARGRSPAGSTPSVINAGDGWHEHPTQALLDCYTIRQQPRRRSTGTHIAIVGDIKHSRVARSDVLAFTALGAEVTLVAPPTLLPPSLDGWPVEVSHDLDAVLPEVDVVYLLRMQRERMTEALLPSLREYTARYGLTARAGRRCCATDALVMHPGPMNRGVEIAAEVADLPSAVIIDQVRNGVAVRMAVLFLLLGVGHRARRVGARWLSRWLNLRHQGRTGHRRRPASGAADVVLVDDGAIAAVGADLDARRRACSTPAAASSRPAWSTCTPTCASRARRRPRRSRPAAARAALGGYTARRGHAQHRARPSTAPAVVREVLELGRARRCATCTSAGAITVGRAGEQLAPMAEMAALGVRLFTDDGTGVQDDRLMRRALEYARGLGVDARPALRGRRARRRRPHARGGVVEPARHPRAARPRPRS